MKDTNYAFCVARIRAIENKLLTKQDISSLIHQQSYESALNWLVHKGYALAGDDADAIIKKQGEELNELLEESVPDKKELEALYILNDYFNLKALVKCAVENQSPESYLIYPSTVSISNFMKKADSEGFSFLKEKYRTVVQEAYNIAVKTGNGKFSDAIIDRAAIDALGEYAEGKNSGLLGEICALLGDTANIKIALRCSVIAHDKDFIDTSIGKCNKIDREKLIRCCTSGIDALKEYLEASAYKKGLAVYLESPSSFEKWCDDEIIRITKSAVYTAFGFAPVVSYFYRKNLEIKTLRMILLALKSDIDKKIIEERVRALYA